MNQRHKEILDLLLEREQLGVMELAGHFSVTDMTIRRDLQALEEQGLLTRIHGGCVLRNPQVTERPFHEKENQEREAKEEIARLVVANIPDGISLYLDTGTTCATIASLLPGRRRDLKIFTNNLAAAMTLFDAEGIEVVVLGGTLGRRSPDLTGSLSQQSLCQLRLNLAIVGADAFDPSLGEFYSADTATAALSQKAQGQADEVYVCIDASKFGKRALAIAGRLDEQSTIFSNAEANSPYKDDIANFGAKFIAADRVGA